MPYKVYHPQDILYILPFNPYIGQSFQCMTLHLCSTITEFFSFLFINIVVVFAIHSHESSMGVHVFPILTLPPHPIPQGHPSAPAPHEHPISCIKPGLAIYFTYDNTHVSMLFSQIIPPLSSPRVQKSVLYICVSFGVSHIGSSSASF